MDDLKLFNGIVSDLFPKIRDVPVNYGEMEQSIRNRALEKGLEDVKGRHNYYYYGVENNIINNKEQYNYQQ